MIEPSRNSKRRENSSTKCAVENSNIVTNDDKNEENRKQKRRRFSFKEKSAILELLEIDSANAVCEKFGINDRTLRKWKNQKTEINEGCKSKKPQDYKKKSTSDKELDDAVYAWFLEVRAKGIPVSGSMLKSKALSLSEDMRFRASDGWLSRWKSRKGLRSLRITGEKLSADTEAAGKYKEKFTDLINFEHLTRAQVFNFDETGLTYKEMPKKTFSCQDESQACGFKGQKERFTIGACCNADGSFKLPLLVIGKSMRPRALKDVNKTNLPVTYKNQKNAWMDVIIFEDWFTNEFVPQVQAFLGENNLPMKAVLIVDNCKAHKIVKIGEFVVTFLPPNVTSLIQPLDQGILETMKRNYKFRLVSSILDAQENGISVKDYLKKVTIKDVIFWVDEAWKGITSSTIYKCWNVIWPIQTRTIATQTDEEQTLSLVLLDSSVGAESHERMVDVRNRTATGMLSRLRHIEEYKTVEEGIIFDWLNTNEEWAKRKDVLDSPTEGDEDTVQPPSSSSQQNSFWEDPDFLTKAFNDLYGDI